MTRSLCTLQAVGDQTYWFCLQCAEEGTSPGDPSWLESSETGAADSFFSPDLGLVLEHLKGVHGFGKDQIEVSEEEIVLK
ncbi:MAG: hypothetical protein ACE5HZ_00410 [Fidelibacterota bacterium]